MPWLGKANKRVPNTGEKDDWSVIGQEIIKFCRLGEFKTCPCFNLRETPAIVCQRQVTDPARSTQNIAAA